MSSGNSRFKRKQKNPSGTLPMNKLSEAEKQQLVSMLYNLTPKPGEYDMDVLDMDLEFYGKAPDPPVTVDEWYDQIYFGWHGCLPAGVRKGLAESQASGWQPSDKLIAMLQQSKEESR